MHLARSVIGGHIAESLLDLIFDILCLALQHFTTSFGGALLKKVLAISR